ncbi:MAG: uncharacterized protein A8A55_2775, partial [Amphiamblys sp. WSBS2006]
EFVIRERLHMRNTGIFFLECLGNTVFIPVIEIEVDCRTNNWGWFGKTTGIHIKTNALVGSISPGIESTGEIKQTIGEMITQKETAVDNKFGSQKLVFEEDLNHGEQSEAGKSSEKTITEHQEQDFCFKEGSKRYTCCDFSDYRYGDYED